MAERPRAEHTTMLACRLPDALIDDAKRYASLYHTDMSKLMREALMYRLCYKTWPPIPPRDMPPGAVPPHVGTLLHDLATHLDQVRSELADVGTARGPHRTEENVPYDGITMPAERLGEPPAHAPLDAYDASSVQYADDLEDMPLHPEPLADRRPRLPAPTAAQPELDFNTAVWCLRPRGVCGHASHGEAGNRFKANGRNTPRDCWLCGQAKKNTSKTAKQPA